MSIFSSNRHDLRVIDLINGRGDLSFQACQPLVGKNAPKEHHWIPNTDKENIPLEKCGWRFIQERTIDIARSYQDLVRGLKFKPHYIKGYIWAMGGAQKWGRLVAKNKLISSFELWEFIFKLSLYLIFSKYEIIHGNITGLHTYIIKGDRRPILMTPNRFVTRPRGSELIRTWCWYIVRGHEDEDNFISLLKTEKNKLIVKLWLLGAMFDCINDTEYYCGNIGKISDIWSSI